MRYAYMYTQLHTPLQCQWRLIRTHRAQARFILSSIMMQSKNNNGEGLMLLVSRMQALVRGTLIRRSLIKLRAEFEAISEELEEGASYGVSTDWPTCTPCRPTFRSAKEDSDVLQRLAKKHWCKPQSSQHSELSASLVTDPATPQYSSDFQSRSSLSSEESAGPSSMGPALLSGSGAEEDKHGGQSHSENLSVDSEGSIDVRSPITAVKESTETAEPMVIEQIRNMGENHEENLDDLKSLPSSKSDKEPELNDKREPLCVSEYRGETIPTEMLVARVESGGSRGNEDDEGCASVRRGGHSEKIMHRQSLNETDFTVVSSMQASSVRLSSSDDESVSADDVVKDNPIECGGVNILDQGEIELEGRSASIRHNSAAAAASNSKTDSPSFISTSRHSSSVEGQALHSQHTSDLPLIRVKLPDAHTCSHQTNMSPGSESIRYIPVESKRNAESSNWSTGQSLGAVVMDSDASKQDSMKDDYRVNDHNDTSVAADMTSVWSTDLSDNDDEQVPQIDEAKLKEMRNNTAMELLWIQQAIESRKNYLRLKSKMNCSDRTDK